MMAHLSVYVDDEIQQTLSFFEKMEAMIGGLNMLDSGDACFPCLVESFPRLLLLLADSHYKPLVEFFGTVGIPSSRMKALFLLFPPAIFFDNDKDIRPRLQALRKIQWDELASIQRPERVSSWQIEPFNGSNNANPSVVSCDRNVWKIKNPRPSIEPPAYEPSSAFWFPGTIHSPGASTLSSTEVKSVENPNTWPFVGNEVVGIPISSGETPNSASKRNWSKEYNAPHSHWSDLAPPMNNFFVMFDDGSESKAIITSPHPSEKMGESSCILELIEKEKKPESCRLFGIDLVNSSNFMNPVFKPATLFGPGTEETNGAANSSYSDLLPGQTAFKESKQSGQRFPEHNKQSSSTRSRTKVHMQGVAVGRVGDLTVMNGYDELIKELEAMFDIKGELYPPEKWGIVFTDNDGDAMLVGDDSWVEFCKLVKKIFICTSEELQKMKPRKSKISLRADELMKRVHE